MKKRRNQLIMNLLNKKILIMVKMLLTLNNEKYKYKMRKILLFLTSLRACKNKLMKKNFHKVTG